MVFIILYEGVKMLILRSECKIDQTNFTDWMEISPNPEALNAKTYRLASPCHSCSVFSKTFLLL